MAENAVKTWEELKGTNRDEFNKRFDTGEFDDYMEDHGFINAMNDGSLFDKPQDSEIEPGESLPAETPEQKVAPSEPKEDGPWWKQKGFESEQEVSEKFDNLNELLTKKQEQINKFNGERGTLGERLKKLEQAEQEKQDLLKKIKELESRPVQQGTPAEPPAYPIAPEPEDGDFGSPEYKVARAAYEKEVKEFPSKLAAFVKNTITAETTKLQELINKAGQGVKEVKSFQTSQENRSREQKAKEVWGNMMGEVKKLQEYDPALVTKSPWEEINNIVADKGYDEASKTLPKSDFQNWERIAKIIQEYRPFDENSNLVVDAKPNHKSLRAAYINHLDETGQIDSFLTNLKNGAARQGREQVINAIETQRNTATPLPANSDSPEGMVAMTMDEIDKKLVEYGRSEYDQQLKDDPKFRREVYDLMKKKPGMEVVIPAEWKKEFEPKKE